MVGGYPAQLHPFILQNCICIYICKYYDSDNIHINEEGSKILASNIKMTLHKKLNIRIPVKQRRSSSPPKKDQVPYHRGTRGGYNYRGGGGRKYRRDGNEWLNLI